MKNYFRLYVEPWIVISGAVILILLCLVPVVVLGTEQGWKIFPDQDQPEKTFSVVIYADKKIGDDVEYKLSPRDESYGYIKFQERYSISDLREVDRVGLQNFPEFRVEEGTLGKIRNWPLSSDFIVTRRLADEWVEDRRNDKNILVPVTFRWIKIVITSRYSGVNNPDVIFFSTSYDNPDKLYKEKFVKKEWVMLKIDEMERFYEFVRSGMHADIQIHSDSN